MKDASILWLEPWSPKSSRSSDEKEFLETKARKSHTTRVVAERKRGSSRQQREQASIPDFDLRNPDLCVPAMHGRCIHAHMKGAPRGSDDAAAVRILDTPGQALRPDLPLVGDFSSK